MHLPKQVEDRKSTRLNSSHEWISYAVFCLKKKKNICVTTFQNKNKIILGLNLHELTKAAARCKPATLLSQEDRKMNIFVLFLPRPPRVTLFPYTTLFR